MYSEKAIDLKTGTSKVRFIRKKIEVKKKKTHRETNSLTWNIKTTGMVIFFKVECYVTKKLCSHFYASSVLTMSFIAYINFFF